MALSDDRIFWLESGSTIILRAVYKSNGSEAWHFTTSGEARTDNINANVPILDKDDTVYFTTYKQSNLCAIYPNGTLQWRNDHIDEWGDGSPVIDADGTIYYVTQNFSTSRLYAFGPPAAGAIDIEKFTRVLEVPDGDDLCDGVKPQVLTMKYTGDGPEATSHAQAPGKVEVKGDSNDANPVHILASGKKDNIYFNGQVALNGIFPIDSKLLAKRS